MAHSHWRILHEIHQKPWAITPRVLDTIIAIVEQPVGDLEAVASRIGKPLDNSGGNLVEMRGPVAVLGIEGPLFRFGNIFTAISGATSVQQLALDLQAAADNSSVKQILLNINSPGGQVDGIAEFADMIREASKTKPVTAYVDGMAASAGYWLAAAAPRIAMNESGLAGSIGVVATIVDKREAQQRQGVKSYEIVSSQSPYKRPDVATEQGRAQIQDMVDSLAEVFISKVAAYRGVTPEKVMSDFGGGKMMIARRAVAAGMADEITTFEPLVARLAAEASPRAYSISAQEETMADQPTPAPATTTAPAAAPATTATTATGNGTGTATINGGTATIPVIHQPFIEGYVAGGPNDRQRIGAILALPEAQGRDQLARVLALETNHDVETARRILAAAPQAGAPARIDPLAAHMATLPNPQVGTGQPDQDSPQAEAQRILAFVSKDRKLPRAS